MPTAPAKVFSIAAGVPFLDVLAAGLLSRAGSAPPQLAAMTVLLPTRRACRALGEAFLKVGGGAAMLLPRLIPLGDVDEDEIVLQAGGDPALGGGDDVPPAVSGLQRQLLLAGTVGALDRDLSPDQAARLAAELGRLLDQVITERLSFEALRALVPDRYAEHWQRTLEFLTILTRHWPAILAEQGCVDAAERRNRLLAAQAALWRMRPPAGPVIAAGSTGSIPATADLLDVVARLPQGCVVLPGLDREAPDDAWAALDVSHPQYGLARLLARLGVERREVEEWPAERAPHPAPLPADAGRGGPGSSARAALIHRALWPAAATGRWREGMDAAAAALAGVTRIDCPGPQEEASAIALVLREALEHPGRTAALVTPDRDLARRVAGELGRWGIAVDDSAGCPLERTEAGAFLRLVAEAVASGLAPLPLLALLKHPLAACGGDPGRFRHSVRDLEMALLRGARPRPGAEGLRCAVSERGAGAPVAAVLERVLAALEPLLLCFADPEAPLADLVRAHAEAAEALAAGDAASGPERLWAGDGGEEAARFVSEMIAAAPILPRLDPARYPALWDALSAGRVVRPQYGLHPRLHVWGLLEARLQHADVMVLGGLNEGTWPPEAQASPWMSRPMMDAFGLPRPERRIGLTAHDFVQAFCAPRVVLTRAARVEGTPTVPSRWLLRIENLVRGTPLEAAFRGDRSWLAWRDRLDAPERPIPPRRPAPRPPVASRPRQLSVTQIETWMRDPYAIYARHILKLQALDPLDEDPGAADYGTLIHGALEDFMRAFPEVLPEDAEARLIAFGEARFASIRDRPEIWCFWWPRFRRIAAWVVAAEKERRQQVVQTATEIKGRLSWAAPAGPFTLTAKADRIDLRADGSVAILDYKTGIPPGKTEIAAGFAPQLPLEAAIARAGGFPGLPAADIAALEFWRLRGGDPAGEVKSAGDDPSALAEQALEGVKALVARFDFAETPYEARPRPEVAPRYSDYEHLARVKEWAAGEEGES